MESIFVKVRVFSERVIAWVAGLVGVIATIPPLQKWLESVGILDSGLSVVLGVQLLCLSLLLSILVRLQKHLQSSGPQVGFISVDADATGVRCNLIDEKKPRKSRLIEMSWHTVEGEVQRLAKHGTTELLLMHPYALKAFPKNSKPDAPLYFNALREHLLKLRSSRSERKRVEKNLDLRVRYYDTIPGFRGRLFANRIELSWYSQRKAVGSEQGTIIFGHCNPTVFADTNTPEGRCMKEVFLDAFESMWESSVELNEDQWEKAVRATEQWINEQDATAP